MLLACKYNLITILLKVGAIIYSTNRLIRNRIRCYTGIICNHPSPNKLILMLKMMEYEVNYVIKPWNSRRIKRSVLYLAKLLIQSGRPRLRWGVVG